MSMKNQRNAMLAAACVWVLSCQSQEANPSPEATTQPLTPAPAGQAAAGSTAMTDKGWLHEDPGKPDSPEIATATATLIPTQGSEVAGTIQFKQTSKGVEVEAEVTGLPKGTHAYHVHLFGDCSSDDGKSAGTHMNFAGPSKNPPSNIAHITGNLGELVADDSGKASARSLVEKASLRPPYSILGRAVIVHEKGNDEKSPPIGAAGGRLACGVIGVRES